MSETTRLVAALRSHGSRQPIMSIAADYIDRLQVALRRIENINNGPDQASGEYRCMEAASIAREALK